MAKRVGVDKWLYGVTLILVVTGLLMVFSASAVISKARDGSPYHFVILQSIYAVLGLLAMTALMKVNYRRYNTPNFVFPAIALTVLLLLTVFFMPRANGAHRWIRAGSLSFEPSEVAKPVLVLFLAWFLQDRMGEIHDFRKTIVPAVLPCLVLIALILKQPDFGTALICTGVTALMLFLAGMKLRYLGYAALASAPVAYFMLFRVPWRRARLLAFLNPEADPLGRGFHIIQSLIAVGTGGIWGRGYMDGIQKLFYLPEPHTDYIFANIAEELGLVGTLFIVALFLVLGYRGMRAAVLSKDPFARFLAFGLTSTLIIEAFFNMSVVLDLVPSKGLTLPFISYGGTSLFFALVCVGVLLNITREVD